MPEYRLSRDQLIAGRLHSPASLQETQKCSFTENQFGNLAGIPATANNPAEFLRHWLSKRKAQPSVTFLILTT
jgi:hypothetical protein